MRDLADELRTLKVECTSFFRKIPSLEKLHHLLIILRIDLKWEFFASSENVFLVVNIFACCENFSATMTIFGILYHVACAQR